MLSNSKRTQINKAARKAVFDTEKLHQIIDESLIAHIAIEEESGPVVIPMLAWRVEDHVYIHGARNSRLIKSLQAGAATCLTFTLFDGWVLARSAFHHSAHYRCAVVFGCFHVIDDEQEKDRLLNHFIEQIAPGRTQQVRLSNHKELTATQLLAIPLNEASVKISAFGVNDDEADLDRPVWAGVLPYRTVVGPLIPVPEHAGYPAPDYSSAYGERWHQPASSSE
ncbi:pyridoxamine 5'-phosphate oxidase family protein [Vibrio navarrensis]|uniref:Pyridoxamine 5'-phosphate oxidase family protein n=2 Tax=Vibrio navarrensis TaxID=29495 RepID=A0AAI9CRD2_9VIBR|nr:pyridoxamine 5'-phosphate oxidase family protein [Vibrio navarrensis]EJL6400307.1 pyridoxamine 5'-phosphate oxidase family protein [Vibrio navarrensis]EJL6567882.1 pyridoxamine 5'-phosphate oxidase family protein [Vibrio navarrensis]EKA5637686.1 pyridoxamine 5'-phosphate oxidase family protein [Vibrio navarrensis]ELN6932428.1 pyridoxamine 5'-phosphate oxidase family protein [Vibrio navarrensis]MBE4619955.1 flavin-nucleotide-binding protein [Vibrio navarrensis]